MSYIRTLTKVGFGLAILAFVYHDDEEEPDVFTVAALFALGDVILDD